jgi:uncharacterized protein YodC (DUF2158 family)
MKTFKRGDVVRLRSGGPRMTVLEESAHKGQPVARVVCLWFSRQGKLEQDAIPEDLLVSAEAPPLPPGQ